MTYTPFLISTVGFIFNKCSRTLLHSTCNVEPQQNIFQSMAGEENVNHNKNQNKKKDTEKRLEWFSTEKNEREYGRLFHVQCMKYNVVPLASLP